MVIFLAYWNFALAFDLETFQSLMCDLSAIFYALQMWVQKFNHLLVVALIIDLNFNHR